MRKIIIWVILLIFIGIIFLYWFLKSPNNTKKNLSSKA